MWLSIAIDSNTLGKHVSVELSSENKLQLWIPKVLLMVSGFELDVLAELSSRRSLSQNTKYRLIVLILN